MAVEDSVVKARIDQILAEKGDTAEARAQIAQEAQAAGVGAQQISRALGGQFSEADVRRAAAEAGQAFSPISIANRLKSGDIDEATAQQLINANVGLPAALKQAAGGAAPEAPASGLTAEQQAFSDALPEGLRDDYLAAIQAGMGVQGTQMQDIADLLKGRGLTFDESIQVGGLTGDSPNFYDAFGAYYGLGGLQQNVGGLQENVGALQPQAAANLAEELTFIQYPTGDLATIPAGYAIPEGARILSVDEYAQLTREQGVAAGLLPEDVLSYDPAAVVQPTGLTAQYDYSASAPAVTQALTDISAAYTPMPTAPVAPAPTAPTTIMSPAITTYAYPSTFGNIDIFNRTSPALTPYTPPTT